MMKSVDIKRLRDHLGEMVDYVSTREDYVMVTRKSRPLMALVNLDLLEDLIAGSDRGYLAGIRQARKEYRQGNTLCHKDVFRSN
jgi:hypothetical protein